MGRTVGIDLGTTNSAVAVMEGGKPKIIPSKEGRNIIPSVVDPINRVVGDVAKRQMVIKSKQIVYSVKRLMGRGINDKDIQEDKKWMPYELKAGKEGRAVIVIEGKSFTPEEISAQILAKAKK